MRNLLKDRRNWPAALLLITIFAIWSVVFAQQGNQVIPSAAIVGGATDPASVYAINFGAKFNGKMFTSTANTCSWTSGQAIFSCSGANFSNADLGKQFTATINSAGGVGAQYAGTLAVPNTSVTIIGVQDATHATISSNFTANSGANWIVAWATNDDAALTAAEAAWSTSNKCGNLQLPTGITATLLPHFFGPGANCLGIEPQADYTAEVQGNGVGATVIGIFPGFCFTCCTHGTGTTCFGGYKEQVWQNFQFNGFGWGNTSAPAGTVLIETGLGSQDEQFACNAFGGSDANGMVGISNDIGTRVWGMSIDGCGKVGCQINGTIVKYFYSFCGDNLGPNLQLLSNDDLTDFGSDYGGTGGTQTIFFNGNGSRYHGIGSNLFACGITNSTAIFVGTSTNNTVILEGGRWNCTSITSNGIFVNGASNNVYLSSGTIVGGTSAAINLQGGSVFSSNSTLTSATAAIGTGAANSKFVDLCGNTYVGTIVTTPANLLLTPCPTATYPTAVPQVTLTGSTGACATFSTQTGNILNGKLTCTAATAASTIVLTPGITAQNGWNCKNSQDITTTANTFVQTGISATTCTLTAASITQNDVIQFSLQQY